MIHAGYIDSTEIEHYLNISETSHQPISEVLRNSGIDDQTLTYTMAEAYGYPFIQSTAEMELDTKTASEIGLSKCLHDDFAPLIQNGAYVMAVSCPDNEILMPYFKDTLQYTSFAVATREMMQSFNREALKPLLSAQLSEDVADEADVQVVDSMDITEYTDSQIQSMIASLIGAAKDRRASDIQIIPTHDFACVFFRIDGQRVEYSRMSRSSIPPLVRVLSMRADLAAGNDRDMKAGKILFNYNEEQLSVRMNVIPTRLGQSVNFRMLSNKVATYKDLGASPLLIEKLSIIENLSQGLVLIVGPTGSGKSTTMIALISKLLTHNINICTVEDPVEVIIEGVNQIDIGEAQNVTFEGALKSFMRHDPDVIVVGEIRDHEVAETALQAADTGHLVISTIHTMDAVSSVSRLLGMGVKPYEIVEGLVAVIAQRLVRRVCPKCREKELMPKDHEYRKFFDLPPDDDIYMYKGAGCPYCNHTGYRGRLIISECMITSRELREGIENGASTDTLRRIVTEQGFMSMLDDGIEKAKVGETTFDELYKFRQDSMLR